MKTKRTLSILLIAAILLSMIPMATGAAARITSLYGWVEVERNRNGKIDDIDIEFRNDDIFDEDDISRIETLIERRSDGVERTKLIIDLWLVPERGVDLSGLTAQNIHIDGATVKSITSEKRGYALTLEFLVPDHDLPFYDISKGDWFFEAVEYTYRHQLMNGAENHTFAPYENTTREQMVTVIWRMHGSPKSNGKLRFTDVKKSSYAKEAIVWATENGIVKGVTDTSFAPEAPITREQLVTLFYRYTDFAKGTPRENRNALSKYKDAHTVSPYAEKAMNWAISDGLINGIGKNTLAPRGSATRAQIATILMRYNQ